MRRFWGILLLLGGLTGAWFSVARVLWQHRAVREFVPVAAEILHSEVRTHRSRRSTSYTPDINYRYAVNGKTYESSQVCPVDNSGGREWAAGIVARYPVRPRINLPPLNPGVERVNRVPEVVAYIDPSRPEHSILVREYSLTPYLFAFFALAIAGTGGGLITGALGGSRTEMTSLALDDSGWKLLLPNKSLRQKYLDSILWIAATLLAGGPVLAHWALVAGQWDIRTQLMGGALGLCLLIEFIVLFRRWSVTRHLSDARLRVKPVPMNRGEVFIMELEADAYSALRVQEMTARVVCIEHYKERRGNKTQTGTRTRGEQITVLGPPAQIPAGQLLEGKGELFFDAIGWPPTTDITIKMYPYYTWEVRLAIKLEGMVDYHAVFPLEVD